MKNYKTYSKLLNEKYISDFMDVLYTVESIKGFIENGGDINIVDENGDNLLLLSIMNFRKDVVKFLINNGIDINHKNNTGENAIYLLIKTRYMDILNTVINKKDAIVTNNDLFNFSRTLKITSEQRSIALNSFLNNKNVDWKKKDSIGKYFFEYIKIDILSYYYAGIDDNELLDFIMNFYEKKNKIKDFNL